MPNRVTHFEIQADDVSRAKNFYEKAFGWKVELWMSKDKGAGMDYWGLSSGDKTTPGINGGMYQRPTDGEKFNLYDCTIEVDDLDKAIADVKANGGTILNEKYEIPNVGWFARAKDTEGNRVGLIQMPKK